jgi:hypothetical protein
MIIDFMSDKLSFGSIPVTLALTASVCGVGGAGDGEYTDGNWRHGHRFLSLGPMS